MSTRDYLEIVPPPGLRMPYGPAPEQFGDLRVPARAGPLPVAVVLHGGWWRAQHDLTYAGHLAHALTAGGVATWNVEYRRVGQPGGGYPGTLHDVAAALAALVDLAPAHSLDLSRIVATGHSAGGHLAAWLGAKGAHRDLDRFGTTPALVGAVPVGGALDLDLTSDRRIGRDGIVFVDDFMGGTWRALPDDYGLASPARLLPTGIPVIAVHGADDDVVPLAIAERYVERARAAGDPARLVALPGVDHFAPFDPATESGALVCATIRGLLGLEPA
jgi:acetyl esterase/lipase